MLYTAATGLLVLACISSLPFAVYVVTFAVLAYLKVENAMNIAFYVWCIASGAWGTLLFFVLLDTTFGAMRITRTSARTKTVNVPEYSEIRIPRQEHADVVRASTVVETVIEADLVKDVTPADAPGQPHLWTRGNFLRAKGTEEMWGTEDDVDPATLFAIHDDADEGAAVPVAAPCRACGTTASDARFSITGAHGAQDLCATCFDALCEDEALKFTGVSLKARHVRVPLTAAGIEASPEYAASKADPQTMQWLVTARFRTRDNVEHPREWGLLDNGDIVGSVVYDNRTKMYAAEALGVALKSERHEAAAKRLVKDIVMDARNVLENALVQGEQSPEALAKVFHGAFSGTKA
jgi:hypothetical protein